MRAPRLLRVALALAICSCAASCATQPPAATSAPAEPRRCGSEPVFAAGADRATLWIRNSSEFRAAGEIIYRAALAALAEGLADPVWTAEPTQAGASLALPPAVVMDIDETVLDNSEPQAEMLRNGTCIDEFPTAWDGWIAKRRAPAVPGAAEFIRAARLMSDSSGRPLRIFFITNRECAPRDGKPAACPQQDDTLANFEALGLGSPGLADELMMRGERPEWDGEKLARRAEVAKDYRIVLNVGDDLADFLPGVRRATVAERDVARCARAAWWGRQWFLLPNPMYGSWLVALGGDLDAALAAPPAVLQDCPRG
jgi:5'-nucleotidase (lipoprotein e(P4) family)